MTSALFQPLLHDPLGWKQPKTSYTDHYKWRKYGSANKNKLVSTYSQRYQRQLRKQKQTTQRSPLTTNENQSISRIIVVNKPNDKSEQVITCRYVPGKTPVFVVEPKQRPASANVESTSYTNVRERPPTAPPTVQEKPSLPTTVEEKKPPKEEKPKRPVDADNDNSRHWLTFPNPKTPEKIIEIKHRLGQLNVPSTLARPSTAVNPSVQQQQITQPIIRPSTASTPHQQKQQANDDQHRFLTFDKRDTPDDLRAARYRIDKYRYHPSLDNYPLRPQTCPERMKDSPQPKNEQRSPQPPKTDVWIAEDERKPQTPNNDSTAKYIQIVNCDHLPNEYANALQISNEAQNEYERNLKMNGGRRLDNLVYRLPAMASPDNKNVSFGNYQNLHQSIGMNNPVRQVARATDNDLGIWMRHATDKERASAMKIVQDVLNPSIIGYDNQSKQPSNRTLSATRKLGHTRTQHKFPCEICEKLLIKRHVWDLSGFKCPHSMTIS